MCSWCGEEGMAGHIGHELCGGPLYELLMMRCLGAEEDAELEDSAGWHELARTHRIRATALREAAERTRVCV